MTDIRERHRKEAGVERRAVFTFALTLLGPAVAVAAMVGLRLGWWPYSVAWTLTVVVALSLSVIGAVGALYALALAARRPRLAGAAALGALAVSGVTLAAFANLVVLQSSPAGPDVTTAPSDPPGFPADLVAEGATHGAPEGAQNCTVQALPSQSAPGAAGYALQAAGFEIRSLGVGRAVGTRHGLWFGTTWDATIRIRPGRTDVRVAAREPAQDRGEACRLVRRIVKALTPDA